MKVLHQHVGFFIVNTGERSSSANSNEPLDAINHTLKGLFASPSESSSTKSTKKTVLKRPNGQVMTEEDVISQIEERNKQNPKRSRSMTNKSVQSKKQQNRNNTGMKKHF